METAQALFYSKGYAEVSVNLIIENVGISKGTFYHYFSSKEELLDQLVQRFAVAAIENIIPIVNDDSLNAIEKLNSIYKNSSRFKLDQAELSFVINDIIIRKDPC